MKTERLKFSLSGWWDFRQAAQCILPYGRKLIKYSWLLDSVSALGEPAPWGICPVIYKQHLISIEQKKNNFPWVRVAWITFKIRCWLQKLKNKKWVSLDWFIKVAHNDIKPHGIYWGEVLIPGAHLFPFRTLELYGRSVLFLKMADLGNKKRQHFLNSLMWKVFTRQSQLKSIKTQVF